MTRRSVSFLGLAAMLAGGVWAWRASASPAAMPPGLAALEFPRLTLESSDEPAHWQSAGFVRLEPPIPLPLDAQERLHADVWLYLPPDAAIDVTPEGHWVWPEGAILDRVEWAMIDGRRRVLDVRGTEIHEDGDLDRAYRPAAPDQPAVLLGATFRRGDAGAVARMSEGFAQLALDGGTFTSIERGASSAHRSASLTRLRATHECGSCHAAGIPEAAPNDARHLRRGTDARGFYVPHYILSDRAPLERYRPVDVASREPFIHTVCGGEVAVRPDASSAFLCADGSSPELVLDVRGGMSAHDPHTTRVCESRRWLTAHLTPRARERYAQELMPCL